MAKRKADTDAAKQAKIAVTQTGIEQRIIKQDFEEAIKTGNIEQFLAKSKEYEQVQEKLRGQLSEELKARGYGQPDPGRDQAAGGPEQASGRAG